MSQPAQYLLRIDDLCPTVHHESWEQLSAIIAEFNIHPILAVVPDNQDPDLRQSPHNPHFWEQMRTLESSGATIGIHGLHHTCSSTGKSLIPLHTQTEFAGLSLETQRTRLHTGLEILRSHGLNPRLWIAPRHGFDRNTLTVLREVGIPYLSDGMTHRPVLRNGVLCIPQQLWSPVRKASGLWTICLHPTPAAQQHISALRTFLSSHAQQFTSFDRIRKEFPFASIRTHEQLQEAASILRLSLRHMRKIIFTQR